MEINKFFWAKKSQDIEGYKWLPLYIHLSDTRYVILFLWDHWLSKSQKSLVINSLSTKNEETAKSLVSFLGAIHDLGKATPAFQTQRGYNNDLDLDSYLLERLEQDGFSGLSELNLISSSSSRHELAGESILFSHGVKEDITSIIGAHHGKPTDLQNKYKNQLSAFASNYFQDESPANFCNKKWRDAQLSIIRWALYISGIESIESLSQISQPGQVILCGLLIMADWISSNTNYFPLLAIEDSEIIDLSERALYGFNKWIKTETWQADFHANLEDDFLTRFGFSPNESQKKFIDTVQYTKDPGIFIFEAPMGIGKTEAALFSVEQLAFDKGMSGMFFALPTQATSNGIFPRVRDWLISVTDDFDDNLGIRLLHGKAYLNDDYRSLSSNISPDSIENATVIVNQWFNGKKSAILDDFIVGTIDQFLLVALKQKHLFLRHLGFSKKVVVIDEVHAYDTYMSRYLNEAITWMGAYNVPVIILSATLPAKKREALIISYMKGKGLKRKNISFNQEIPTDTYPLITFNDGSEIKYEYNFNNYANKSIEVLKLEEEKLMDYLDILYHKGGNIGIILNTVDKAQKISQDLASKYGDEKVFLIHSRFIDTDRISKEKELLEQIGKGATRPSQMFYVGTQVIEQSLDIDFDLLITELSPIDLMIQRMGRLHRHNISRSKEYKYPKVVVIGCSDLLDFDQGSSFVYSPYILARSQYFLLDEVNIPKDVSTLVQKVYSVKDIVLDSDVEEKYLTMKREYYLTLDKQKDKADVFKIKDPKLRESRSKTNSLIGWLANSNEVNSEEKAYAQVRDTNDTIEVIVLKKVGDGYGIFSEQTDISNYIEDNQIAKLIASNTIKLPQILTASYNIDSTIKILEKYNSTYLTDFQFSPWLKGSLGIIFNENDTFELNGYKLFYDTKYGLSYERM